MLILLTQFTLAASSARALAIDPNVERQACVRARRAAAAPLIEGLRLAKVDPEVAIKAIPDVVTAMFALNAEINARPTIEDRRNFSACVNAGLFDDLKTEIDNVEGVERARLRLYAQELSREGMFERRTLAGRRAYRKMLVHDATDFGATLLASPVVMFSALIYDSGSITTGLLLGAGALASGLSSWLVTSWNDRHAPIHGSAIGFAARSCADILARASHSDTPALKTSRRLGVRLR